jgi:lipid II:glycine glycyltransferase (peptidoglycan interpeptide bridge formation enzyme)
MDIDTAAWDKNQKVAGASFLQSSGWGQFQDAMGNKTHYLFEENWSCLLIEKKTPLGNYLFGPYGPTLKNEHSLPDAIAAMKKYARQAGFDWLTLEPFSQYAETSIIRDATKQSNARPSDHNREPDLTRILDLKPSEDEMLASISQSTRSFIRKNQREQFVTFRTSTDPADIGIFIEMLGKVTERKNIVFFSDEYFMKQADILMPSGMMYLDIALFAGKPVASAIFNDFGKTCNYTYAGSLPEARQTSASALLLWQAILNAKKRDMELMDLYGIAPDGAPSSHPWYGFSEFKKKFGGQIVERAGTWDIPLSSKYWLYRTVKSGRRAVRWSH